MLQKPAILSKTLCTHNRQVTGLSNVKTQTYAVRPIKRTYRNGDRSDDAQTFTRNNSVLWIKANENRKLLPLVALATAAAVTLIPQNVNAQEGQREEVTIENTKLPFNIFFEEGRLSLLCFAQRTFTAFKIKTYVMALYMDPSETRRHMSQWKDTDPSSLLQNEDFFNAFQSEGLRKAIRICPSRDIQPSHLCSSLSAVLTEKLSLSGLSKSEINANLLEFKQLMPEGRTIYAGQCLDFVMDHGQMTCYFDGQKSKVQIKSPSLCWAFLEVYIGKNPKTPAIKESLTHNFRDFVDFFQ